MESKAIEKMYLLQLQDLYSAGKQLTEALPKLIKLPNSKDLKSFLKDWSDKNRQQLGRIESILRKTKNFNPQNDNCDVIEEFLEEMDEWIEVTSHPILLDAGFILLSKKIFHYQLAVYETLISYCRILSLDKICDHFTDSLQEVVLLNARLSELLEEESGVLVK